MTVRLVLAFSSPLLVFLGLPGVLAFVLATMFSMSSYIFLCENMVKLRLTSDDKQKMYIQAVFIGLGGYLITLPEFTNAGLTVVTVFMFTGLSVPIKRYLVKIREEWGKQP